MKLKSLSYLLTLVMVLTLAGAGCTKKPGRTTPLPNPTPGQGSGETPIDKVPTFDPTKDPNSAGIDTANWPLDQFNQDRDALAAQTVHFDYDSHAVKASERPKLAAVAAALASDPSAKLLIEGHCDERGTDEYNRSLGERRALALREALAADGLDAQRVRTISYGKDRRIDLGASEASHAKNRRGVFVLLHPK